MARKTPFRESAKTEGEATWVTHLPIGPTSGLEKASESEPADKPKQQDEPENDDEDDGA